MANRYFDCTQTIDFHHELCRMCKTYEDNCFNEKLNEFCPVLAIYDEDEECKVGDIMHLNKRDFLKMTAIVQQWSDSHPTTEADLIQQDKIPVSEYINCGNCFSCHEEISW